MWHRFLYSRTWTWSLHSTASTSTRRRSYRHYKYSTLATPMLLFLILQEHVSTCHATTSTTDHTGTGTTQTMTTNTTTSTNNAHPRLRLYFVRHGESAANQWGLYAGQEDVPLTEEGKLQAQTLGSVVSSWPTFWRLYSSDLVRARNTAVYVLQNSPQKESLEQLRLDERLRERSYGARQGMSRQLTEEQALNIWRSHNLIPPIYETDEDLWQRGSEWLLDVWNDLQQQWRQHQHQQQFDTNPNSSNVEGGVVYHVFVSSHAGIIREFLKHLVSKEELQAKGAQWDVHNTLIIPNTSVTILEFDLVENQDNSSFLQTATLLEVANAKHLEYATIHGD